MNGYFTPNEIKMMISVADIAGLNAERFIKHCEAKQRSGVTVTGGYEPKLTIERQVNSFKKSPMA